MVTKKPKKGKAKSVAQFTAEQFRFFDELAQELADGDEPNLDRFEPHVVGIIESRAEWFAKRDKLRKKRRNVPTERREKLDRGGITREQFMAEAGAEIYKLVTRRFNNAAVPSTPVNMHGIFIPRWLYFVTKNHDEQRLLAQLVYWFGPDKDGKIRARVHKKGHFWVAKTDEDMYLETDVPVRTLKRARAALVNRGILVTLKANFDAIKTTHYRIDWEKLEDAYLERAGSLDGINYKSEPGIVYDDDPEVMPDEQRRELKDREKRRNKLLKRQQEFVESKQQWKQEKRQRRSAS